MNLRRNPMAEIRFLDAARVDFENASNSSLQEALRLLGKWVGRPIRGTMEVSEYDEKSGEPLEYEFVPCENWDGRIWLNTWMLIPNLALEDPLYNIIINEIPEGDIVKFGDCDYVIEHVPSEGYAKGAMPAHIRILKPRILPI
jgi:hypothetical protein